MLEGSRVSVVIPCYNEEAYLGTLLGQLPEGIDEVVVVDNNSTDRSREIAESHGARVVSEERQGYGFAYQAGFAAATGDVIATLDADAQYPPEAIPQLVRALHERRLDFISTSRFPMDDKSALPFLRRFGNWLLTTAANFTFSANFTDIMSGMWVFRRAPFAEHVQLESGSMPFTAEIKLRAWRAPAVRFGEEHVTYRPRSGTSKLAPGRHGAETLWLILRLRALELWASRQFRAGLAAVLVSLAAFSAVTAWRLNDPFSGTSSDVNADNGLAVRNWILAGPLELRGGYLNGWHSEAPAFVQGSFYTHHPAGFLVPGYLTSLALGSTEVAVRLAPWLALFLSLLLFIPALQLVYRSAAWAAVTGVLFALFPATQFYGTTYELAVLSIPCILATFSLFVFHQHRPSRVRLILLLASVAAGGLTGWFFYFFPAALWLYVLLSHRRGERHRLATLLGMPAILGATFALNIAHFWLLNGSAFFANLVESFGIRAMRVPLAAWLPRTFEVAGNNLGTLGFLLTFAAICVCAWRFAGHRHERVLLTLLAVPLLNILVFYQWTGHPFGFIFWLAPAAVLITCAVRQLHAMHRAAGVVGVAVVFAAVAYSGQQGLARLEATRILLDEDLPFAGHIGASTPPDATICIGENNAGLPLNGIIAWHLKRATAGFPQCTERGADTAIVLAPKLGDFYKQEAVKYVERGFEPGGCAGILCDMHRVSDRGVVPPWLR